jgi:hypothetical protein
MFHTGQELSRGRPIACELIGDEHPGDVLAPLKELAKERLGNLCVSSLLHEYIEDIAVLSTSGAAHGSSEKPRRDAMYHQAGGVGAGADGRTVAQTSDTTSG